MRILLNITLLLAISKAIQPLILKKLKTNPSVSISSENNINVSKQNISENFSKKGGKKRCPVNCESCFSFDECTSCKEGFFLFQSSCEPCQIDNCQECLSKGRKSICSLCDDGFFLDKGVCSKCANNCQSCSTKDKCLICETNSELEDGICIAGDDEYWIVYPAALIFITFVFILLIRCLCFRKTLLDNYSSFAENSKDPDFQNKILPIEQRKSLGKDQKNLLMKGNLKKKRGSLISDVSTNMTNATLESGKKSTDFSNRSVRINRRFSENGITEIKGIKVDKKPRWMLKN